MPGFVPDAVETAVNKRNRDACRDLIDLPELLGKEVRRDKEILGGTELQTALVKQESNSSIQQAQERDHKS
jgi:hypothetical protein